MTPKVGQTVQFFEHADGGPRAAIVTAAYADGSVDLAAWELCPVYDESTWKMVAGQYGWRERRGVPPVHGEAVPRYPGWVVP